MKDILIKHSLQNKLPWLFLFAWLLLCITIWLVFIDKNTAPDETVFNTLAPYISNSRTEWMKKISFLGNHKFLAPVIILFIILLLIKKNKSAALAAAVLALSSFGLMTWLKYLTKRLRPADPMVEGITNFSFPSGHAFMSVAFCGLMICWASNTIKNNMLRRITITFILLLIVLISFSRIYLRVHYTTDVIAGFCIGYIWFITCFWLLKKAKLQADFYNL